MALQRQPLAQRLIFYFHISAENARQAYFRAIAVFRKHCKILKYVTLSRDTGTTDLRHHSGNEFIEF